MSVRLVNSSKAHGNQDLKEGRMYLTPPLAPPRTYQSNRRLHDRYPLALKLQYKIPNKKGLVHHGCGRTLDISSGGVLFEADCLLPASGPIELAIDWPYLLDGVVSLELVMKGPIVRSDTKAVAVKADHYEFLTAGARFRKSKVQPLRWLPAPSDNA
jgi:hypothetical protein